MPDFNPNYDYAQQAGYQGGGGLTVPSAQSAWAAQNRNPFAGTQAQDQNQLPSWLQQSPTVASPTMGINNMVRALMAGAYAQSPQPTNVGSAATYAPAPTPAAPAPTAPAPPPAMPQAVGAISGQQAPAAGAMYSGLFSPPTAPVMPPSMLSNAPPPGTMPNVPVSPPPTPGAVWQPGGVSGWWAPAGSNPNQYATTM